MIYNAGHLVTSTQLAVSRQMFSDMISSQKLNCHKADGNCSLDEMRCDYLNHCNGHGNCVNGRCVAWDEGYYGADCSITTKPLDSTKIYLHSTHWQYYQIQSKDDIEIDISDGNTPIEVYIQEGDIPTRSSHHTYYKGEHLNVIAHGSDKPTFVAVYNPSFTTELKAKMYVNDVTAKQTTMIAVCVCLGITLLALIISNLYFCLTKRKQRKRYYRRLNDAINNSALEA